MEGVIIFAVVYAIVAILGKVKEAQQKGQGADPPQPRPERQRQPQRPEQQPARPRPASDTRAEGAKLEDLLRVLTEAAGVEVPQGPVGRPARVPLPSDEEVEETESLEVEEQIQNLETETRRSSRAEVDFDDEAEAIAQRRIRAAAQRDRSLSRADHRAFDSKIRAVPDKTVVAKPKQISLRQAVIWREILGPPVALRDPLRDRQDLD
jgi:hypothetical protein